MSSARPGLHTVCFCRKGTVVNSTGLVFLAGTLMGFSRICGSPEMVIFGRFVTGIHSGMPQMKNKHVWQNRVSNNINDLQIAYHLHSGISLSVVPMYLGEIAPKNLRGFLGLVPSIFICIGVFSAQVLGLHELLGKVKHTSITCFWLMF